MHVKKDGQAAAFKKILEDLHLIKIKNIQKYKRFNLYCEAGNTRKYYQPICMMECSIVALNPVLFLECLITLILLCANAHIYYCI